MNFSTSDFRTATQHIPPTLQVVFESDQTGEILGNIALKHNLDISHLGLLSDQVAYVLIGLLKKEQFHESVMRELNLRPSEADAICAEVEENIFKHIATDLAHFSSGGAPKFTRESSAPPTPTSSALLAPETQSAPTVPSVEPTVHNTPSPSAQHGWEIPLNPVVTEAQPTHPRIVQSTPLPVSSTNAPTSSPSASQSPPTQVASPTPHPVAPIPPPPKEELIVPHKVAPGHTSNMPGMRHPWLSDAMKLPDTATAAPKEVKQQEKKGLTEKPKPPVAEISKTVPTPLKPTVAATEMKPATIKNAEVKRTEAPVSTPSRTPEAPSKSVPPPLVAATIPQKTAHASSTPTTNNIQEQQTSPEVIMPGKGVNIPVPKMVSRLPIEERESSRITIVRKTSEPQVKSQAAQSIPSPAPATTPPAPPLYTGKDPYREPVN